MAPLTGVAVIFTSMRTDGHDAEYDDMADQMFALARLQDGFISVDSVRDPVTRLGITVSYWRDEASARAWKQVNEHLVAQAQGKEHWYASYEVVVADISRRYAYTD